MFLYYLSALYKLVCSRCRIIYKLDLYEVCFFSTFLFVSLKLFSTMRFVFLIFIISSFFSFITHTLFTLIYKLMTISPAKFFFIILWFSQFALFFSDSFSSFLFTILSWKFNRKNLRNFWAYLSVGLKLTPLDIFFKFFCCSLPNLRVLNFSSYSHSHNMSSYIDRRLRNFIPISLNSSENLFHFFIH